MANKKISELQSRTPSLSDLMLVGDPSSGYSYKCTITALATLIETDIADGYVTIGTTQTISGAKTFSNVLTLTSVANATTDPDKFLVLNGSNVVNYRTGSEVLSDIGAADDSLVVHKAGTETITGVKTFNAGLSLPNYQQINLSNSATIEGYDGKVLFRTITGVAGYFQNNSLGLAAMDNETGTSGIGFLVKNFGGEGLVKYKTAAQALSMIGAQGALTLTTTGTSGAATLVGNTLNIPQYQTALTNPVTGTGTTNYVPKFTGTSSIGNSQLLDDGTTVFLGTSGTLPNVKMIISTTTQRALELNSSSGNALFVQSISGTNVATITNGTWATQFTSTGRLDLAGDLLVNTIANATTDTDKFLVSDSGVIKYRTGTELLSDIGGAASSSISGTTNYIPKFTSSSAIGNSVIYESSSNIGIGTTSPTSISNYIALTINGTSGSFTEYQENGGRAFRIGSDGATGGFISQTTADPIRIFTNASERMRITSDGEVYIAGTTDQGAYNLQVNGTGVWGAGAYVNGSDRSLKENIYDLDGCLELVKQLKPVTYKYKESYSKDNSTQTGFIAQDLKELFKNKSYLNGLVKEGGEHLSVAYQNLIPVLAKAIQELEAEIETLKNK